MLYSFWYFEGVYPFLVAAQRNGSRHFVPILGILVQVGQRRE